MKINYFLTIAFLFCFFPYLLYAQRDYLPCTIKFASGDTKDAWVNYRGLANHPRTADFKFKDGSTETMGFGKVVSFSMKRRDKKEERYVLAIVNLNSSPREAAKLEEDPMPKMESDIRPPRTPAQRAVRLI